MPTVLSPTNPACLRPTRQPPRPGVDAPTRALTPQQLLKAIHNGRPFRQVLRGLGLTPNQVWGLTKTYDAWSEALKAALTATRRADLRHGTNAAYIAGCFCKECREHQRVRMRRIGNR
jgi:hypothetical protein